MLLPFLSIHVHPFVVTPSWLYLVKLMTRRCVSLFWVAKTHTITHVTSALHVFGSSFIVLAIDVKAQGLEENFESTRSWNTLTSSALVCVNLTLVV